MPVQRHVRHLAMVLVASALASGALVAVNTSPAAASTPEQQIAAKARKYASKLGAPVSSYRKVSRYGKRVTYRKYRTGLVAHNGSAVKLVTGKMYLSYKKRDSVSGTFGAPVTTKQCGLRERACVQRFQHGAIYRNNKAMHRVATSYHSGRRSTLIATARSQVGYREPGVRRNKYGKWINGGRYSTLAWCGFFQSWASGASGNRTAIPWSKSFPSLRAAIKKRGGLHKQPAVGDLAFIDYFHNGTSSHTGLVVGISRTKVEMIEGNVDSRGGSTRTKKGVYKTTRPRSQVRFYATPRY